MRAVFLRNFTSQHRLLAAITGAVIIAMALTAISMSLYYSTGAEVLDLSRPGYESVRKAVESKPHDDTNFSGDGPIDAKVIKQFDGLYQINRKDLKSIDDFSNQKPLSDDSLGLSQRSANSTGE
ncbi:MAG TPA: hypothetical protein VFL81_01535 [Candidatus Saccharimonadales bacterium]|nr:hypothetical protein [Candidatus Saccharimonadales bacterium]